MIAKTAIAFLVSIIVTYTASVAFYTQQVIAKIQAVGAEYSTQQQIDTFRDNFMGLAQGNGGQPSFLQMFAVALAIGYGVAFLVKRILKPLAPVAYPIAGAAAIFGLLWTIEATVAGGGVGAIGGARDAAGFALQALAGFLGGAVFAFLRPR